MKEYLIAFLILETLMVGVFVSLDIFLFYVFFEAGLIPMFLIIGIWGGKERVFASLNFSLYPAWINFDAYCYDCYVGYFRNHRCNATFKI